MCAAGIVHGPGVRVGLAIEAGSSCRIVWTPLNSPCAVGEPDVGAAPVPVPLAVAVPALAPVTRHDWQPIAGRGSQVARQVERDGVRGAVRPGDDLGVPGDPEPAGADVHDGRPRHDLRCGRGVCGMRGMRRGSCRRRGRRRSRGVRRSEAGGVRHDDGESGDDDAGGAAMPEHGLSFRCEERQPSSCTATRSCAWSPRSPIGLHLRTTQRQGAVGFGSEPGRNGVR